MHGSKSTTVLIAAFITLLAPIAANSQAASNARVLFSFSGGPDGAQPLSELVFDSHGNLYGTTHDGGDFGDGTVFELTPASNGYWGEWSEKVLHNFHNDHKDGAHPDAGLIFDKAGNLWGTTENGGTDTTGPAVIIGGTVFELLPGPNGTWTETVFSFQHASIHSGLIFDKAGNIYGTTMTDPRDSGTGGGTVFKLTRGPNGTLSLTTLYAFRKAPYQFMASTPSIDGIMPVAGLVIDEQGNLYGTTSAEGIGPKANNDGIVFRLSRDANGKWEEGLMRNTGSRAGLVIDAHGNLYGITNSGGTFGYGTVFELSRRSDGKWDTTILHNFNVNNGDAYAPKGRLLLDKAGNLYGTAGGPANSGGSIFKLSPNPNGTWTETLVHVFNRDWTEGNDPEAGLILDAQGNLYGTTARGGGDPGTPGQGAVFAILAGSGPAVSSDVLAGSGSPVSSDVQTAPPTAFNAGATTSVVRPVPSSSANPMPSSPPATQGPDPLASIWQSDAYAGQTFHFKLEGNAVYVYGDQQQLLGTLQGKEKKGVIDMYQGLVQIPPVTQCPGGSGLMQIKSWSENRLDAKIETPVNTSAGITCGGVLGSGRLVPWQKITFVKR